MTYIIVQWTFFQNCTFFNAKDPSLQRTFYRKSKLCLQGSVGSANLTAVPCALLSRAFFPSHVHIIFSQIHVKLAMHRICQWRWTISSAMAVRALGRLALAPPQSCDCAANQPQPSIGCPTVRTEISSFHLTGEDWKSLLFGAGLA